MAAAASGAGGAGSTASVGRGVDRRLPIIGKTEEVWKAFVRGHYEQCERYKDLAEAERTPILAFLEERFDLSPVEAVDRLFPSKKTVVVTRDEKIKRALEKVGEEAICMELPPSKARQAEGVQMAKKLELHKAVADTITIGNVQDLTTQFADYFIDRCCQYWRKGWGSGEPPSSLELNRATISKLVACAVRDEYLEKVTPYSLFKEGGSGKLSIGIADCDFYSFLKPAEDEGLMAIALPYDFQKTYLKFTLDVSKKELTATLTTCVDGGPGKKVEAWTVLCGVHRAERAGVGA